MGPVQEKFFSLVMFLLVFISFVIVPWMYAMGAMRQSKVEYGYLVPFFVFSKLAIVIPAWITFVIMGIRVTETVLCIPIRKYVCEFTVEGTYRKSFCQNKYKPLCRIKR